MKTISSQTYHSFFTCRSCGSLLVLSADPFDGFNANRCVIIPICIGFVIIRICETCYLFDGYVLTPVMLSYLPKLYVISLDLQGLLLFDGSLSYTSFVIISRCRNDVICWICKRTPFDGLCTYTRFVSVAEALVISGFWCSGIV